MAFQANRLFAHAASSFIGFAAPLALVVFRTTQEKSLPHFQDISLVRLADSLILQLSVSLLWSPLQLPLCELSVCRKRRARLHVTLPENLLRENTLEAYS